MPFFVLFIFGAVVIGAGAMLAPAWPTPQPRIGLAAALALGVVMGGAIFWSMLFGWDTLAVDYLLFVLVTSIFLGGTLSYGQKRAEARGETLEDADQGWPGPQDLSFFGFAALVFIIPALILPVPLDTDAQGFGYLGLMAKLGGSFDSLAPFHPEIHYLYSPGFTAIIAYLSHQLGQGLHTVQISVGAVLSLLCVWLAYDFGGELRDKRLGRTMAAVMLGGVGLFTAYMDSHFTSLLGLVFALAFLTYALRYLRYGYLADIVGSGLMLGALVLAHPDTTIITALGYVPWLLTMWFGEPRPTLKRWLILAIGVPLIAVIAISPWLWSIRDLLGSEIVSPFARDFNNWRVMVLYHGVWIVPPAILGAVVGLRKRDQGAILATVWLIMALDFSSLGILERIIPWLIAPVMRYDYPFSIAWHGPIIPYSILGGMGLLWLWDRVPVLAVIFRKYAYVILGFLIVLALAGLVFHREILLFSKGRVGFFGAFSSAADVEAMLWLKNNTPRESRILNFPGENFDNSHESDWVAVISERDSIYYRWQPFFRGNEGSIAEQDRLRGFWQDPANPEQEALLRQAGIDYVIVPQLVNNPESIQGMFRWRPPFTQWLEMRSTVADAAYLRLVFESDGAEVYVLENR
jgi:hypothetical protein